MKLSKEETQFIAQVMKEDGSPHFDICLEDNHAAQLKHWLHTLSQATDIQVIAKVNSEVVYFPAQFNTTNEGLPTFSCDLPNIFSAETSNRHWITKRLNGIVLKIPHTTIQFSVLSLSLSGLVIRTHPYLANYIQQIITQAPVTLALPNERCATFEVALSRFVNETAVALEIMNINSGLDDLKETIFELYNDSFD